MNKFFLIRKNNRQRMAAFSVESRLILARSFCFALLFFFALLLSGCQDKTPEPFEIPTETGSRPCTPICLVPTADGTAFFRGDTYLVDYSNASEGYIMASYNGTCEKVKLQITTPEDTTYSYNLSSQIDVFPLTSLSGEYKIAIFENVQLNAYSTLMTDIIHVDIQNEFGAYLYPNQYVKFSKDNKCIELGSQLARSANSDLEVVSNVYNYMISHITYDTEKADTVEKGYLPDIDDTLATGTGICLDYSAVMASMLRSQNIPTHMEVGFAGKTYHAWISTYITDIGWVNGIVEFNGTDWELMDPTLGASVATKKLKKYIGEGDNYVVKYVY